MAIEQRYDCLKWHLPVCKMGAAWLKVNFITWKSG